jgi:transposase
MAALRYDGRHKVGDELAAALIAAAAGSMGRHHKEVYRIQVRYTCQDLDVLRRRLRDLERDIDRLLEQHEIGRLLTTIDGIGPQTSARLVATFGDFRSFSSARAVASYVGAVPALKQSWKRTFQRASLTPIGAAHLRAKLWMPVLAAVRTNPWLRALCFAKTSSHSIVSIRHARATAARRIRGGRPASSDLSAGHVLSRRTREWVTESG